MKIRFIWPGKTRDEKLSELVAEYLKRLRRFVRSEVVETREFAGSDGTRVERESQRILDALPNGSFVVLLDVNGREWDSRQLAAEVSRWENESVKEVAIVIGGPEGVSSQ